jgi:ADP-ribosylglycohydrolase
LIVLLYGGGSDTIACIAGGIAEAFYGGVPDEIVAAAKGILDERLNAVVGEFERFRDA